MRNRADGTRKITRVLQRAERNVRDANRACASGAGAGSLQRGAYERISRFLQRRVALTVV